MARKTFWSYFFLLNIWKMWRYNFMKQEGYLYWCFFKFGMPRAKGEMGYLQGWATPKEVLSYLRAAVAVSSLLVSKYLCIPTNVGLSLGLRSQHCIINIYISGGQAFGAVKRWPSRIISRSISLPFKPVVGQLPRC